MSKCEFGVKTQHSSKHNGQSIYNTNTIKWTRTKTKDENGVENAAPSHMIKVSRSHHSAHITYAYDIVRKCRKRTREREKNSNDRHTNILCHTQHNKNKNIRRKETTVKTTVVLICPLNTQQQQNKNEENNKKKTPQPVNVSGWRRDTKNGIFKNEANIWTSSWSKLLNRWRRAATKKNRNGAHRTNTQPIDTNPKTFRRQLRSNLSTTLILFSFRLTEFHERK